MVGTAAILEDVRGARVLGPARIERAGIRPNHPDNLREIGAAGPLPDSFRGVAGYVVDAPCDRDPGAHHELAVQISRHGPGHALLEGIVVRYRVGAAHFSHLIHAALAMCDRDYDGGIGRFESCQASEAAVAEPSWPDGPMREWPDREQGAAVSAGPARPASDSISSCRRSACPERVRRYSTGSSRGPRGGIWIERVGVAHGIEDPRATWTRPGTLPAQFVPLAGYRLGVPCGSSWVTLEPTGEV